MVQRRDTEMRRHGASLAPTIFQPSPPSSATVQQTSPTVRGQLSARASRLSRRRQIVAAILIVLAIVLVIVR